MKISVIGGGIMGTNHARVLKDLNKLHQIIELDKDKRKALYEKFGDLVCDGLDYSSDCYVIATPTSTHYQLAKDLIRQNKPILIEKPLCKTTQEATSLREAMKSNSIVAVGHVEHYNPVVQHTKEWLANRKINILNTYRLGYCDRILDVGVVLDLAIHDIEVMCHLLEDRVTSVRAIGLYKKDKVNEQYCKVFLKFSKGVLGCLEVSWIHPSKIRKIELVGDTYFATADYLQQTFTEEYEHFVENVDNNFSQKRIKQNSSISLAKLEPLRLELEDFIYAVENNIQPSVSFEQGFQALKIVEAILLSLNTDNEVEIIQ